MMMNQTKLDEVRTIILSLLVSRKNAIPVPVLERDYYEVEQQRIPYRQFGHTDLVQFLQSMPDYFIVEHSNGNHYVRGRASDKSRHVQSLVGRQKGHKYQNKPSRFVAPPHTFNQRIPHMKPQRVRIAPDKLLLLMQYVKSSSNGLSLQVAAAYIQQLVPYISVSTQDLRDQLRELSHELYLDGNMIYSVQNNDLQGNVACVNQQPSVPPLWNESASPGNSESPLIIQATYAAGQEEFESEEGDGDYSDENDFLSAGCTSNSGNSQRRAKTSEQLAINLAQYAKYEQTPCMPNYNNVNNNIEIEENDYFATSQRNTEVGSIELLHDNMSKIISDRTKLRLEELLQKYPDGIWCAQLPDLYLKEYNVHLNYKELGFTSVREFTSYLPKIFYMTQINKTDDFILHSADKRPVVPKTEPTNMTQALHNRYDEHNTMQTQYVNVNDNAPIPSEVSPTITKRFAPKEVMNYGDDVKKISVTDLRNNRSYLEVYIVEVFHPNFFWIHLRENKKEFNKLMVALSDFYEYRRDKYTVAKVALKKDLHCACIYMNKWHRGVIKSVKPDFRVTVFFYDYGTLKTYAPEDIYYLHNSFSTLPAQAIACGLCNVKSTVSDRWKKSVIDKFIDKIADTLLAATIMTIDPKNNTMMIVLTDTSDDDKDVVINDWLVKEKLAQFGKTVRIRDPIHYMTFDTESSTSIRIFHRDIAEINVNRSRYYRDQLISRDKKAYRSFDVKSEDIEKKTVKSLHNVLTDKKNTLENKCPNDRSLHVKSLPTKSLNAEFPDTKTLDAKLQSRNNPQIEKLRTFEEKKISLLEKLKMSSPNRKSNSNSSMDSLFEANTDNEANARQIDSSREIKSGSNSEHCHVDMDFSLRDSDGENQNDFGTFRSLYGGNGLMEPFDWSVIREENISHKTTATSPNNSDTSIRECKSDVEDNVRSHNQRNEIPGKQYFLNVTSMEKEIFLPENNIDYDIGNMSDVAEMLKNNVVPNHTVKVMFTPNEKLKTSHDSVQSEDTSNSNTNVVALNNVASRDVIQKVKRNGKMYKTRTDQKIEKRDSDTNSESVLSNISNNNKDKMSREISECSTNNSFESSTSNKVHNSSFKLMDILIGRSRMNSINSSFINTSESSSEQIRSSSYSCNTSSDTIISSNNESVASDRMDTNTYEIRGSVQELASTSELSETLTSDESHGNSEGTRDLSSLETDTITSLNVDDTKPRLNQSLEIASSNDDAKQHRSSQPNSIASSYKVDDLDYQLTAADQTLDVPKLMQRMLKIAQNIETNIELDSDDLSSSQESLQYDKSDESKGDDKSICMPETCELMNDNANVTEIAFTPPVYNDCDVESDESEWDVNAGSIDDFPFYIVQSPK